MKEYTKYGLAVVVGAAVMVAYQYQPPSGQVVSEAQPVPGQSEAVEAVAARAEQSLAAVEQLSSKRELTQAELADIDPASIDWDAVRKRSEWGVDPMMVFAKGKFSEAEIAAYNKLHVIPFNPEVDLVCVEETYEGYPEIPNSGGVQTSCESIRAQPKHAYQDLAIEELKDLAYSDAVAAAIAGRKAKELDEKAEFFVRAAALSGKSGPLLWLAANEIPSTYTIIKVDGEYQDVPLVEQIVKRSVLESVAESMGDPRANSDYYKAELSKALGQDGPKGIELVGFLTQQRIEQIRSIRTELGLAQLVMQGGNNDA